jgi:hypothetical protein
VRKFLETGDLVSVPIYSANRKREVGLSEVRAKMVMKSASGQYLADGTKMNMMLNRIAKGEVGLIKTLREKYGETLDAIFS